MIAFYPKVEIKMIKKRGFVLLIIKGFFGKLVHVHRPIQSEPQHDKKKKKKRKKKMTRTAAPCLGIRLHCPHEEIFGP